MTVRAGFINSKILMMSQGDEWGTPGLSCYNTVDLTVDHIGCSGSSEFWKLKTTSLDSHCCRYQTALNCIISVKLSILFQCQSNVVFPFVPFLLHFCLYFMFCLTYSHHEYEWEWNTLYLNIYHWISRNQ